MAINHTIDILFAIDIFVSFNSAYMDEKNELVESRKKIACSYIKSWFFIDALAVLPFDIIMESLKAGNANSFIRIARVSKIYKLVKITRLLRLSKIAKHKKKIEKAKTMVTSGGGTERLSFFILAIFLMCHLISCLFIF